MPFVLPDWVPWWVPLILLLPALMYGLAFLFMPFSVMGVKTRLEAIEAGLEDLRQDLRLIAMRLPTGQGALDFEDLYAPAALAARTDAAMQDRPPVPPPSYAFDDSDEPVERQPPSPDMRPVRRQDPLVTRPQRSEPRLDRRR